MTLLFPLTWSVRLSSFGVWYGDVSHKARMHALHLKLARKLPQRFEKGRVSGGVESMLAGPGGRRQVCLNQQNNRS